VRKFYSLSFSDYLSQGFDVFGYKMQFSYQNFFFKLYTSQKGSNCTPYERVDGAISSTSSYKTNEDSETDDVEKLANFFTKASAHRSLLMAILVGTAKKLFPD
jgi:hypothetical protein